MERRKVGVCALLPTGENATEAVEPGVGALDDPAAGAEAGLALERLRLLATAAYVGCEANSAASASLRVFLCIGGWLGVVGDAVSEVDA